MIAVAFASFAGVAAITVFLWRIQPLAAAGSPDYIALAMLLSLLSGGMLLLFGFLLRVTRLLHTIDQDIALMDTGLLHR